MRATQQPSFTPRTPGIPSLPNPTPVAAAAGSSIHLLIDEMKRITNAANASHSTGPKTAQGKARSSQNALQHGAFAHSTLLPTDDPQIFESFRIDFLNTLSPQTTPELFLAERLVSLAWRLQRLTNASNEMNIDSDILDNLEEIERLAKAEDRLQSMFHRALKQFHQLQKHHQENPPAPCPFLKKVESPQNQPTAPINDPSAQTASEVACVVAEEKAQNEPRHPAPPHQSTCKIPSDTESPAPPR